MYDVNGDGSIDIEEVTKIVRSVYMLGKDVVTTRLVFSKNLTGSSLGCVSFWRSQEHKLFVVLSNKNEQLSKATLEFKLEKIIWIQEKLETFDKKKSFCESTYFSKKLLSNDNCFSLNLSQVIQSNS